jgi:hypothetical protein
MERILWQEQMYSRLNDKARRLLHFLLDIFTQEESLVVYTPIILVTFFMFCGASWQLFLPATDVARYQCYAMNFWFGTDALRHLPLEQCASVITTPDAAFHSLPTEYPPLTLLAFSIPLLIPLQYYQFAFTILMSLVLVFVYGLLRRYGPRGGALCYAIYMFLGALGLAQLRFDLLPAFCTLVCVVAAERKHWRVAYIALAFGVLFKIYPILLLPALFLAEQHVKGKIAFVSEKSYTTIVAQIWQQLKRVFHWQWQNCLLFLGLVLGVTGIFAMLDFNGAIVSQLSYFLHRPIQIESTGSSLAWLAHFFGIPWLGVYYDFGSVNIVSNISSLVSQIGTLGLILGFVYVLWLQIRGKIDLTQAVIALLLVFVATGKVFSPQYLIWLIPLLAYAGAFDLFWLFSWGVISLQTMVIYIFFNSQLVSPLNSDLVFVPRGFLELVMVRNTFLVLLTLAYLFNWFRARQRRLVPGLHVCGRHRLLSRMAQL